MAINKKAIGYTVGAVVLLIGAYFGYKYYEKKQAEKDAAGLSPSDVTTPLDTTTPANTTAPTGNVSPKKYALVGAKGSTVFLAAIKDGNTVSGGKSRTVSTSSEKLGAFEGFTTINAVVFVVFKDRLNSNKRSLIVKSNTNY